jgi:hypothetical protein
MFVEILNLFDLFHSNIFIGGCNMAHEATRLHFPLASALRVLFMSVGGFLLSTLLYNVIENNKAHLS